MARGFGSTLGAGTTDVIRTAAFTSPTVFSYAGWFNRNGAGGLNAGRILDKTGTAVAEIAIRATATPTIRLDRVWSTTAGQWTVNDSAAVSTGAWVHLVITYDGSSTGNNPVFYVNGRSVTVTTVATPAGTLTSNSGVMTFGNRSTGGTNWDGILGDEAFWNGVILTASEARALFQGADPRAIRPNYLFEHLVLGDGLPYSTKRASQPVITGTRARADRLVLVPNAGDPFTQALSSGSLIGGGAAGFAPVGVLTGAAAIVSVAAIGVAGSATLAGQGALSSSTAFSVLAAAGLSGAGALTGAVAHTLAGVGSLTNAGSALALSGSSVWVAAGAANIVGSGTLVSIATLGVAPRLSAQGYGALVGKATLGVVLLSSLTDINSPVLVSRSTGLRPTDRSSALRLNFSNGPRPSAISRGAR